MAANYQVKTDYYQEGKKLSDDMWTYFMKQIVDGDNKLFGLAAEAGRLKQQFQAIKASTAESHAQLRKMDIELVELEMRLDVNQINMKRQAQFVEMMKGIVVSSYI